MKMRLEEQFDAGSWLNLALPFTNDPVSLSESTARTSKGRKPPFHSWQRGRVHLAFIWISQAQGPSWLGHWLSNTCWRSAFPLWLLATLGKSPWISQKAGSKGDQLLSRGEVVTVPEWTFQRISIWREGWDASDCVSYRNHHHMLMF